MHHVISRGMMGSHTSVLLLNGPHDAEVNPNAPIERLYFLLYDHSILTNKENQSHLDGSHLRDGLPVCGVVLAGMDAVVPSPLHHVEDGLHRDVELGRPADLQVARRLLQEHQLLPGLQRDS